MYDSLEGLDWKRGELSPIVSSILQSPELSKMKGRLIYKKRRELEIGDVIVKGYSSHLVLDPEGHYPRVSSKTGMDPDMLVIPKHVLAEMRQQNNHV